MRSFRALISSTAGTVKDESFYRKTAVPEIYTAVRKLYLEMLSGKDLCFTCDVWQNHYLTKSLPKESQQ
jgi:hypothetical protein